MAETATVQMILDARAAKQGAQVFEGAMNKASRAAGKASKSVDRTNTSVKNLSATLKSGARLVAGFFGAFTAVRVISSTVKVVAEFGEQVATLGFITQATVETLGRMKRVALEFGASTRFTTTQVADAMIFLARTGFDAEQTIAALPSTLNLSQVGFIGLGEAADLASNVVRQFGLDASETERVVDALFNTTNQTNTNIQQLGQAMKFAGPIAGAMGQQVERVAAAIGILGDRGIQASLAGTNLRAVMLNLVNPTQKGIAVFKEMGLTAEELNPAYHDLVDVLDKLAGANLNVAQAGKIFNRRSAAAALILTANADGIRRVTDKTLELTGATAEGAQVQNVLLRGALFSVRSAWEALKLSMLEADGAFTDILFTIANTIRILAGMDNAATEADKTAQKLAFSLRVLRTVLIGLIGLKIVKMVMGAAVATNFYAASLTILRVTALSAALAQGAFATATTLAAGAVRILAIAMKTLFASIGPAGWIIIGVGLAIELFLRWKRNTDDVADSIRNLNLQTAQMSKFINTDIPAAVKGFDRLAVRMARVLDTQDIQGQLFTSRAIKDAIETMIEDFSLAGLQGPDIVDLINVDEIKDVMGKAGGDAAIAMLAEMQQAFDNSDEGKKLRESVRQVLIGFRAPLPDPLSGQQGRAPAGGQTGVTPQIPVFRDEPFLKTTAGVVTLTDVLKILGDASDRTKDQIKALEEALKNEREEAGKQRQKELIQAIATDIANQTKILIGATAAFDHVITVAGTIDTDVISAATRAASDEQERLQTRLDAVALAKKNNIELDHDFLDVLDEEVKKQQEVRNAHEDMVSTLKDETKATEDATRASQQAQQTIEGTLTGLEQENERLQLSIALQNESKSVRIATLEVLRAEQLARGETIDGLDTILEKIFKVTDANSKLADELKKVEDARKSSTDTLGDSIKSLEEENERLVLSISLLGRETNVRLAAVAALAAEQSVRGQNIANLQEQLDRIRELTKANADMSDTIDKNTKSIKDSNESMENLFKALQNESVLMFRTNEQRERAETLVKFQAAAARELGEGTDAATAATEKYLATLDKLEKLRRIKELADGLAESFSSAFGELITGAGSLEEVLETLLQQIIELIVQTQLLEPLFNNVSEGFGNLFGAQDLQGDIASSSIAGAAGQVITTTQVTVTAATATSTVATQTGSIGTFTGSIGSLTGSIGSFTGSIGSITGTIGSMTGSVLQATNTVLQATNTVLNSQDTILTATQTIFTVTQAAAIVNISTPFVSVSSGFSVGAQGMAIGAHGRLQAFAQGGARIVTQPEFFPLSGGRTGLRGEAGPEIVAPAVRLPNGQLGLQLDDRTGGKTPIIDQRTFNFNFPNNQNVDGFRRSERQIASRMRRISRIGAGKRGDEE